MRFMMLLKSDHTRGSSALPDELLASMANYNAELRRAGVLLAAEEIQPGSKGARISFPGGKGSVTDRPLDQADELLSGFWPLQVESREELGALIGSASPLTAPSGPAPAARARIPALAMVPAGIVARCWNAILGLWWAVALSIAAATSRIARGSREDARDCGRLGPYTLVQKLGEGGMGVVYRARHAMLQRPAAVKVLPPDRLGAENLARFEREVQLTASLTHPNTIRIFDYGLTPDGVFYYAMEHLDGANLADAVAEAGPMTPGRVIHLLDQIAGALGEAHGKGLIHCDIKPANLFLTEQGGVHDVAKVLDFGLVKQVGAAAGGEGAGRTGSATVTGTPLYMAPEAIISPDAMDARTDLYALGAVGYFLLTGHDVFSGRSLLEVCGHHLHSTPVPPSHRLGAPIPSDLERVILSCLEKDPLRRPADARALQTALRACRDAGSWSDEDARRWHDAHAGWLRARRSRAAAGAADTMAVDPGRRTPGRRAS